VAIIEVDQEVADFLKANEALTGENASECFRRLLTRKCSMPREHIEISRAGTNSSRFLSILKEIHDQYGKTFANVSGLRGRKRTYFSRDAAEIESSGNSTMPIMVPGTPWYVLSNTSTDQKLAILKGVFRLVGCSYEDSQRWTQDFIGKDYFCLPDESSAPADDGDLKI
jgi:negative regulator of replication initiation